MQLGKECYMCGRSGYTEEHHVFGASNRKHSDQDGLVVRLCPTCHRDVHERKPAMALSLKREAQRRWMEYYGKDEDAFRERYIRSYLE